MLQESLKTSPESYQYPSIIDVMATYVCFGIIMAQDSGYFSSFYTILETSIGEN